MKAPLDADNSPGYNVECPAAKESNDPAPPPTCSQKNLGKTRVGREREMRLQQPNMAESMIKTTDQGSDQVSGPGYWSRSLVQIVVQDSGFCGPG